MLHIRPKRFAYDDDKDVLVKEILNFDEADNFNIEADTIRMLYGDLNSAKENSIACEDFREKKTVLIGDEAHHLSAASRNC